MISKNQIKQIQALHQKKHRESENLFIVEGIKTVTEFIQQQTYKVKQVFGTLNYIEKHLSLLNTNKVVFSEITEEELNKISAQQNPNQVLAIVEIKKHPLNLDLLNSETTLYLDDIRDPGNLGTIIRIADWFGIKQIFCSPQTTEVYNPKTIQASMGAILRVNLIYEEFSFIISKLNNIPIYASVLNGDNIYTTTLKKGIIVIGNEANGISEEIIHKCTHHITIPSASNNGSESLNAAIACSIICSEFQRQLSFNN